MKYIIVTGGELFNKGAQAMTYICADEIAKRWPDTRMILFSSKDTKRSEEEKDNYRFSITFQPGLKDLFILRSGFLTFLMTRIMKKNRYIEWHNILSNTVLWLDISGYGLGSYWKPAKAVHYMLNVAVAKKRKIHIYLLPQSFGPFDYKGFQGAIANAFIRHYLPYVSLAMAREEEGKNLLERKYHFTKVVKTPDMVLQNNAVDYENVFKKVPKTNSYEIAQSSVAVIPNVRNNKYGKENIFKIYRSTIDTLLENGNNVYLVYHAVEDLPICREIKELYKDNDKVILIENEIKSTEMDEFMRNFSFILGSRFHSIVHAYKSHVPAIVIGWATKYQELLSDFHQSQYMFDARGNISIETIGEALIYMIKYYPEEKAKITEHLAEIQKENVFDLIECVHNKEVHQ